MTTVRQSRGDQVSHFTLSLQPAMNLHEARTEQFALLSFGQVVPHHHIDHSRFVFERDEDDAGGRARALSAGDQPGYVFTIDNRFYQYSRVGPVGPYYHSHHDLCNAAVADLLIALGYVGGVEP
jgi:hypothetical protein